MNIEPTLTFPVIRGIQAHSEYYVAMWTLRMLRQISILEDDERPPELRNQRTLNRARISEISRYIVANPDDYLLSAITVSIDLQLRFEPLPGQDRLGMLHLPMDARYMISDGQHRWAAIVEALTRRPELASETIPVIFLPGLELEGCQQRFADLNRHAVRPSHSLGLLYDQRNDKARLAKQVIMKSDLMRQLVDMEKPSLSKRSRKLFTLSSFCAACADLMASIATGDVGEDASLARDYWESVADQIPAWRQVTEGEVAASKIREGYIHAHGITLRAFGQAGNALLRTYPQEWHAHLGKLREIDWSRRNAQLWEGRALTSDKVIKRKTSLTLTTNIIKQTLGLPLDEEQQKVENAYNGTRTPRAHLTVVK